jgi:hypothetical protein
VFNLANGPNNSLRRISEVVGSGQGDIKKGLKIDFIGEEGVDAGGLRKEWFLLLIREVFDEAHGEYISPNSPQVVISSQVFSCMMRTHASVISIPTVLSRRSSTFWSES